MLLSPIRREFTFYTSAKLFSRAGEVIICVEVMNCGIEG
jgi:hypothetical protein